MPDPFAHGTPAGDSHTWVDPSRRDCPDCECCTIRLCRDAVEAHRTCLQVAPMRDADLVRNCPCTVPTPAARDAGIEPQVIADASGWTPKPRIGEYLYKAGEEQA